MARPSRRYGGWNPAAPLGGPQTARDGRGLVFPRARRDGAGSPGERVHARPAVKSGGGSALTYRATRLPGKSQRQSGRFLPIWGRPPMPECPICSAAVPEPKQDRYWCGYDCPRCGRWSIEEVVTFPGNRLELALGAWDQRSVRLRSPLSHVLRRQQRADSSWVQIPPEPLESWHLDDRLPTPSEQLDQLLVAIGDQQPSPQEPALVIPSEVSAWIGATIVRHSPPSGLHWASGAGRRKSLSRKFGRARRKGAPET